MYSAPQAGVGPEQEGKRGRGEERSSKAGGGGRAGVSDCGCSREPKKEQELKPQLPTTSPPLLCL